MLTILGAAIGNNVQFEIQPGWKEKPNLFTAIVGHPGAKKTPALKIAMNPLRLKQDKDREEHSDKVNESKIKHDEWKLRKKKAEKEKQPFNEPEPIKILKKRQPSLLRH